MGKEQQRILVTGATGSIGSEVVRALQERDSRIRVLVRNPAHVAHLPDSIERVQGDLADPQTIEAALDGVSAALYVSPHSSDEVTLAENFISACETRGIRLVYTGVHIDAPHRWLRALLRFLFGTRFPHYKGKFRISERALTAKTDSLVLAPTNYYQNDELYRQELVSGRFPVPLREANRVDLRDVGDAAARALTDTSVTPGAYALVGPTSLSSADCASVWSEVLGTQVRDTSADTAAWTTLLAERLPARKATDFEHTYRLLGNMKVPTSPGQLAQTTSLLGRPPRSYTEYVRDTTARWRAKSS